MIRIASEWRRAACLELRVGGGLFIIRTGQSPAEFVREAMRFGTFLGGARSDAAPAGAAGLTDSKRAIKRIGERRTAVPTNGERFLAGDRAGRRPGVADERLRGSRRRNRGNGGNPECLRIRGESGNGRRRYPNRSRCRGRCRTRADRLHMQAVRTLRARSCTNDEAVLDNVGRLAFMADDVHSMTKVSHAGEHHGHAMLVRRGDDLIIAHRPTWLNNANRTCPGGLIHSIPEGEEGIRGDSAAP